jgi:hypothetical protein
LASNDKDSGVTKRENLERKLAQARRSKHKNAAADVLKLEDELKVPEFPKELSYLWRIHQRLRRRTASGFNGPNPIEWRAIDAFVRRTGFELTSWEIEMLEAIDDAFMQPSYVPVAKPAAPATELIDASDTKSVRSLFKSIGLRRKNRRDGVPSLT